MPSLYKDNHAVSGESDISRRRPVISQSRLLTQRNHTSSLPDLDVLAIVRNSQDKLLRADGNSCVFIVVNNKYNNDYHVSKLSSRGIPLATEVRVMDLHVLWAVWVNDGQQGISA